MTKVKQMTTNVANKMDCVFACIGTSWCRSVNFKITPEIDDHHICELIATDNYTNPKYLKQNEKFTHLNIKVSRQSVIFNLLSYSGLLRRLNHFLMFVITIQLSIEPV
jgi:hypothetical protein